METINDVLREKGTEVYFVTPETTVFDALRLMAERNIGALIVREDGEEIIGIFSERDYARKSILIGKDPGDIAVKQMMTTRFFYAKPELTIEECMAVMTRNKFRHIPVLENGKLAGIVSIGDIVKSMISEKDYLIDQLENYISGSL